MNIIITGRHGLKVPDDLKNYATEKIKKYEKLLEEPAVCEIMFADVRGPQDGVDKVVHINLAVPHEKLPLHVETITQDFFASIDVAQEKLEQEVLKYKERVKIGDRNPKKYYEAKLEEEDNKEL